MTSLLRISMYIILALVVILMSAGIYIQLAYTHYQPEIECEVDKNDLGYFYNVYDESRTAFIEMAKKVGVQMDQTLIDQFAVPSRVDDSLMVDYCFIPGKQQERLMIMVSGVHGAEGFIGSAMQQLFVKEYVDRAFFEKSALLLVHGMNPYGFKYNRRVTENNVDLNRNSHIDPMLFGAENEGYSDLNYLLNPEGPVELKEPFHRFFVFQAIKMIVLEGMNTLRQAVMQGQYEFPKGVYYGGDAFEPQIGDIQELIDSLSRPYNTIFAIDIHSGFGERGKMHLFPNPLEDKVKERVENIFNGFEINWGGQSNFYSSSGVFLDFIGMIHPEKKFIPMLFEFGTLNSQSTLGSIKSLHYTMLENQGYHHGFKKEKDKMKVQRDFRSMFYPETDTWKSSCCTEFRRVMDIALPRYLEYK